MDVIIKNQEEMMHRIVRLEKSQIQAPRPPFKGQFQKGNQFYKPKNENEVPNTLAPLKMKFQYGENPPFFMTLTMNNKYLNNCMLDTGAGANMMSLKVMQQMGLKVTRPYRNVCGFESKAIPTHGVVENVEVHLKEYLEKTVHIDIIVVDVPDVWGMLLSRKFGAMIGGSLEMDLTFLRLPLKDGTMGRLLNVPITGDHVQDIVHPINNDKAQNDVIQTLQEYSPEDMPFATEEDFDQIEWPKKEEYQQLLDEFKNEEVGTVKILKKNEDDLQICSSQQEVFAAEAHPPPSVQYTRVVQGTTKYKVRKYKEGDMVWMWDTQKGEPTNVKGSTQSWLEPFKVGMESFDNSYYLSTLEGRRRPLPISGHLHKPHQGGGT
jgi:hypothetical protein